MFVYGAAGTGKTHTMLGNQQSPGIIFHTINELYTQSHPPIELSISYIAVYNEKVYDLIHPRGAMRLQNDPNGDLVLDGMKVKILSKDQLFQLLQKGNGNRTQYATDTNAKSSRSHAVFQFVEVNGLRLTEPKQAYVRILQELTDKKLSPDQAQQLLNKRFSGNCKKSTIILVDELDYLCNRRQDVVYNILDWPTKRGSALVVLTISNTMDLPERTLKGRVTSRMGLTRVTFQPYSFHQLKAIVEDRLSGTDTFHPDAVQLVARKVAAVSGDARRALDICRRTTELVTDGEQVTASHVQRALEQIFSGPRVTVIQRLCRQGQLVLRAIRDVNQRTGVDEVIARQVYQHLLEICLVDGCPRPTVGAMLETCVSLVALGLIVAEKGRVDVTRKMSLNVSSDDIHYALNKTKV